MGLLLIIMAASVCLSLASSTPEPAAVSVDSPKFLRPKSAGDAAAVRPRVAAAAEDDRALFLQMGLRFVEELATAPAPGNATLDQEPELGPWLAAVRPLAAGLLPLLVSGPAATVATREAQPHRRAAADELERTPHQFVPLLLGRHSAGAHAPIGGAGRAAAGAEIIDKELELEEAGRPQDEEQLLPRPPELQDEDGEGEQRVQLKEGEQPDVDREEQVGQIDEEKRDKKGEEGQDEREAGHEDDEGDEAVDADVNEDETYEPEEEQPHELKNRGPTDDADDDAPATAGADGEHRKATTAAAKLQALEQHDEQRHPDNPQHAHRQRRRRSRQLWQNPQQDDRRRLHGAALSVVSTSDGVALRAAFGISPSAAGWGGLRGWGRAGENPWTWEGVTCNYAGRVSGIDLRFKSSLGGFELGPALGNLIALTFLYLGKFS